MTTKTTTKSALKAPSANPAMLQGAQVSLFERGTDLYERVELNGEVELDLGNGQKGVGTVHGVEVGPLISLIASYGPQNVYNYGRPSSNLSLVQALTKASSEPVLDVTKLYTVLIVSVQLSSQD